MESSKKQEQKDQTPEILDLSGVKCPLNYAKTSVKLAGMDEGCRLLVILDNGSPIQNVPGSVENEGHQVLSVVKLANGKNQFGVLIQKC